MTQFTTDQQIEAFFSKPEPQDQTIGFWTLGVCLVIVFCFVIALFARCIGGK